jgi:antitoxin component YwqK of YwqJK toxin-antitoxin module
MILEKEVFKEYHSNGQLMYETTFAKVEPMFLDLYTNTRTDKDGIVRIRTGTTKRFWDNGQLNWQLNYDENGNLINEKLPQFRKDGSVIEY